MLIDINANIGHWPFNQTNCNNCQALLERMNRFGVNISVVSNMNGIFYKDTHASNEELIDEINSDKLFHDRFLPFGIINPIYAGWKNDLEICYKKFSMRGIRLYPQYHDYELTDLSCIELVKMARDHEMIVALTIRMVDSRPRHWMDLNKEWELKDIIPIIKAVPDAKFMILNVANGIQLKEDDQKLLKNTEILIDTSGRMIFDLSELMNQFGKNKFAFGTHSPIFDYLSGLLRIESQREDKVDEATKELIRSGNAKVFLGI
jgi:uncharacterized protein